MSSARDEADDGPDHEDSEEESQISNTAPDSRDVPSHGRNDLTTRPREVDRGDGMEEEEDDRLIFLDHPVLNNGIGPAPNNDRPTSRDTTSEIGRPSSADGSLSIPDDTPSVQVRA